MPAIHLLPLGDVPTQLLHRLVAPLEARFAAPVVVEPPEPLRPEWRDSDRGRYHAAGILALARLRPPRPNTAADDDLLFRRALTETVHELGHLAGLDHCPDERCAMYPSRTLEDTDRKAPNSCERCRR